MRNRSVRLAATGRLSSDHHSRIEILTSPLNYLRPWTDAAMAMNRRTKVGLTRQTILGVLRRNRGLLEKHAVRKIALFGSYAKGRPTANSDIDLLVEFERPTYDNFLGLSRDLERLFGRKVEILTPQGLASIRVKAIAESIRKTLAYA